MNIDNLDKIKIPEDFDNKMENIYKNARRKSQRIRYIRNVAALFAIIFAAGFTVPGYTRDLPVYSQLFSLLGMEKYQDSSDMILTTVEDNGVKITLSDVILSNNVLSYTYIIESDKDLGENIIANADMDVMSKLKYNITGTSGSSKLEKKGEKTYLGVDEIWLDFGDKEVPQDMSFTLNIRSIRSFDSNADNTEVEEVKGNWKFPITIKKLPGNVVNPTFIYEESGVFAKINSINIDSAVTNMELNVWNNLDLLSHIYEIDDQTITLKDQDGKTYTFEGGGSNSDGKINTTYFQTQFLEKGKKYTLEMDIVKNGELGYNEKGEFEMVEGYDSEEFKKAPDKIRAVIPFEL